MRFWSGLAGVAVCAVFVSGVSAGVTIETVPVGNLGNVADTRVMIDGTTGYGAVSYAYNIGKYEVTAGQYTAFLNAVAATNTYGLYNTSMWSSEGCKIQQSGSLGSYSYSVAADYANRPVNYVSWYHAARFTNWLTTGEIQTGVYMFSGDKLTEILDHQTAAATLGVATAYFIPTEDEWYKAAYHKNDGITGNYFTYPTSSNTAPSNDLVDPDPGNNATYYNNDYTIGYPYYRTEVGAHENSDSPYGTFDQGGNVWEWNETTIVSSRGLRGGAFYGNSDYLASSDRLNDPPTYWSMVIGFRVASSSAGAVPEPGSLIIWTCGGLGALLLRRRRK